MKKLPKKNLSVDSNPAYLKEIDASYQYHNNHLKYIALSCFQKNSTIYPIQNFLKLLFLI